MEEIKAKEGLVLSKKEKILLGGAIVLTAVVGFKLGARWDSYIVARGIEKAWEADPTLKEHMVNVLVDAWMKKD